MLPEARPRRAPAYPAGYRAGCYRPVLVPEMNRRNVMLTFGIGALAAAIPAPKARA